MKKSKPYAIANDFKPFLMKGWSCQTHMPIEELEQEVDEELIRESRLIPVV